MVAAHGPDMQLPDGMQRADRLWVVGRKVHPRENTW